MYFCIWFYSTTMKIFLINFVLSEYFIYLYSLVRIAIKYKKYGLTVIFKDCKSPTKFSYTASTLHQ